MAEGKPVPTESIPKYVRESVERQDPDTLRDIAKWAEELATWKNRKVDVEEIENDLDRDEQLDDVVEEDSGTIVQKKVSCGKNCGGCPHGPYEYRVTRHGDSLDWEYLGKIESE